KVTQDVSGPVTRALPSKLVSPRNWTRPSEKAAFLSCAGFFSWRLALGRHYGAGSWWVVRRSVEMEELPVLSDLLKHECHSAGRIFELAVILLRLFPFACRVGSGRSEHFYSHARHIKCDVLYLFITFRPLVLHSLPALCNGAVVVEKQDAVALVVRAHH